MKRLQLFAANYNEGVIWVYESLERWLAERDIDFVLAECRSEEEVIRRARHADIYLAFHFPVTRRVIASLPRLKLLISSSSGYEHIDVRAATEHGVVVANTASHNVEDVAEHALMLIFACGRKLRLLENRVRQGYWHVGALAQPTRRFGLQTVGLIGFGRVARALAWRLKAIGFRVLAYDPYIAPDLFDERGVQSAEWEELLRQADYVSLHLRKSDTNRHLLGTEEFQMMKPTAFVINTSRGSVVDEAALIDVLQSGRIAGAALDVFENEPPDVSNPLLHMENVIVTGHAAGTSIEAIMEWQDEWRLIIEAFISGRWPLNVVNPEVRPKARLS